MSEHKFHKRDNATCTEIKGAPMYKCSCGKRFRTKGIAENHCKVNNNE